MLDSLLIPFRSQPQPPALPEGYSLDGEALPALEELDRLEILDTPAEERFDRIVRLAAKLFNVPIAYVALLDGERQWFKARKGLDVSEPPRELAFCAHAILKDETLLVEDATNDERFAQNPLVTGAPDIRFYMGAPLITSDGHALGTLCVIDQKSRKVTAEQRGSLEALRRVVVNLIEQRTVSRKLAVALENVSVLQGLLPICAHCKSVRNDQGYWDELSHYVTKHTDLELTHGICPDCMGKHFPQFANRPKVYTPTKTGAAQG